jgi:hypothetical protein
MSSMAEITAAIERLSEGEKESLRKWFLQPQSEDGENDDILVPATYRQKVLDVIDNS